MITNILLLLFSPFYNSGLHGVIGFGIGVIRDILDMWLLWPYFYLFDTIPNIAFCLLVVFSQKTDSVFPNCPAGQLENSKRTILYFIIIFPHLPLFQTKVLFSGSIL